MCAAKHYMHSKNDELIKKFNRASIFRIAIVCSNVPINLSSRERVEARIKKKIVDSIGINVLTGALVER